MINNIHPISFNFIYKFYIKNIFQATNHTTETEFFGPKVKLFGPERFSKL
jgi:hypothetical protein